jgi:hypothetical protein
MKNTVKWSQAINACYASRDETIQGPKLILALHIAH